MTTAARRCPTRTHKSPCDHLFSRQVLHPAGCHPSASCGGWNRTNIKAFRAPRPTVRRPRIKYSRHARLEKARGVGVEPTLPGSKPGGLPLADPRSEGVPCGSRSSVRPTAFGLFSSLSLGGLSCWLEAWNLCRSAKGTWMKAEGEGVEPSRLLRSPAFEAAAIANWLALPLLKLRREESNLQSSP